MLYVVSTPIGNLKDFSFRAVEILKQVDFILCEDTRTSSILLSHYEINKPLISFNAVNEEKRIEEIYNKLDNGESGALISDAGTPLISDPGYRLVNELRKRGIKISPIPGASALIAALSVAGVPTDSFVFEGFLPQKKGRQKELQRIVQDERTIIIYESPYRIKKLLSEIQSYAPERKIVICRELTKKFEECLTGSANELLEHFYVNEPKGEFVVILAATYMK